VLGLGPGELALAGVLVAVGSLVQGTIGFGFALVTVPYLALVAPEAVPASLLLLGVPLNVWVAARDLAHVHRDGVAEMGAGLLAGSAAGVVVLRVVDADALTVAFGAAVLAGVIASALHPGARFGRAARVAGGIASGVVNTVAATGGPMIALLYQRRRGEEVRSTLAATFLIGIGFSIAGLAVAGRIGVSHVRVALALVPAMAAGVALSRASARLLDRGWLRPAVLLFAAASGVATILRGILRAG